MFQTAPDSIRRESRKKDERFRVPGLQPPHRPQITTLRVLYCDFKDSEGESLIKIMARYKMPPPAQITSQLPAH
jgi:hypothetical protein